MILQPQAYLEMMPSKGVRNAVIDGLEVWYQVPEKSLAVIREIVNLLHSSSLMYVPLNSIWLLLMMDSGWMISKITLP